MSGCSRACTVALRATGKHTYVFGDLQADAVTAVQVLACAAMHQQSVDGALPRKERPERMRNGILAKLPPFADALVGVIER
ncbi:MAG: metal-binding protein [Ramlibacter sp.]|jgi:predicted metal-binding protein|nr:metal-binding protein [Ramlibacter sp.]